MMKFETKPNQSSQINTFLPQYISETYRTFVEFMTTADESEERFGFSRDILQRLMTYEDFDTYKKGITAEGVLAESVDELSDEIVLNSSFGFPPKNGVVMIDEEVILYRALDGDKLTGCMRGSSATTKLRTYNTPGEYVYTDPSPHDKYAKVKNLSTLFLVSMLETIHSSFVPGISKDVVDERINKSSFLQNVKDFFQSKGTALGIKSLFKIIFGENDVDVFYPGDQMIKPSVSTWTENLTVRCVPIPDELAQLEVFERHVSPDLLIGQEVLVRSYNDDLIYGQAFCDYVTSYTFGSEIQYELWLNKSSFAGEIPANPKTVLTRALEVYGGDNDNTDETTITVESTLGFPDSGVIIINREAIYYENKSFNQFLNCRRGYDGVEREHIIGSGVYGPYYLESESIIEGQKYSSRSFPLGLVESVRVDDPGLLHEIDDTVFVNGPGRIDPRDYLMESILENYDDVLATQVDSINIGYIANLTYGASGVYFDKEFCYVSSSNLPEYTIGPFSNDNSVGPDLLPVNGLHIIPRRDTIKENDEFAEKGNDEIAMFRDGTVAFSEVSPESYIQGTIARFDVIAQGEGYKNPTVIITPNNSTAEAVVENGRIISIDATSSGTYYDNPEVRISSGEDASFSLNFDKYGRVIDVFIMNPGQFYIDEPYLQVIDESNRGKGAVIKCVVAGGQITGVEIINKGIDYNPSYTSVRVLPVGEGAVVEATTQFYRFNRYEQIKNNPNWTYDRGGGFLWENEQGVKSRYGYIGGPIELIQKIGEGNVDADKHSPLIGWAFDGNPIYGPYGYENGKDDSSGIARMNSGYTRMLKRDTIDASGGVPGEPNRGFNPPTPTEFPMGTFVEDYVYNPKNLTGFIINTELDEDLQTETNLDIEATVGGEIADTIILDEYNGRQCNTPEFPYEFYPDGVYCYFLTFDRHNEPEYPYIIGKTFKNRPITQKITVRTNEQLEPITRGLIYDPRSFESPTLEFDYDKIARYRNPYLTSTKDEVDIEIGSLSTGSISDVLVIEGLPDTCKVDDLLYFDNSDTGGSGAEARVEFVKGEEIDYSYGTEVVTRTISHHLTLDLSATILETYVFIEGSFIETTSGSQARVLSYDADSELLEIDVITPNLPLTDDCFYDNRGTRICLPGTTGFNYAEDPAEGFNVGVMNGFVEPRDRPDGSELQSGDLWWSPQNGRMYVYFIDEDDTKQWVVTQPIGMRPFNGALDETIGNILATSPNVPHVGGSDNTITISNIAPSQRPDGQPNVLGDLWWSPHTGILYIWYSDYLQYALDYYQNNNTLPGIDDFPDQLTAQWVCADPSAKVPTEDALNELYPDPDSIITRSGSIYSAEVTCTVASTAPPGAPVGALWWCSANGKMFIRYDDGTSTQWVITNPHSQVTSFDTSFDEIVDGPDGGGGGDGGDGGGGIIDGEPEGTGQDLFWFENLTHFEPGDLIEFEVGTPGFDQQTELAKIKHKGIPHSADVIRGYAGDTPIEIPDKTPTFNKTRAIYTVETVNPHRLRVGDEVIMAGSEYDEINGRHTLITAGTVEAAQLQAVVDPNFQTVSDVLIISPGKGYTADFFVQFTGGGGTGALAFVKVTPFVGSEGGQVYEVELINGGVNYTSEPEALLGGDVPNTSFSFYVSRQYPIEYGLTYSGKGKNVQSTVSKFKITSPGVGYRSLPIAKGIIKSEVDRAQLEINLVGDSIGSINVISGGTRYVSPRVVFEDLTGNGSGAKGFAFTDNGTITNVSVLTGGSGYLEPVIHLVEGNGDFVCLTKDIGMIKSLNVLSPGRKISADRARKPELQIDTRVVVVITLDSPNQSFDIGSTVYQGNDFRRHVTATVKDYDSVRRILTLEKINGVIKEDELLYDESGTKASIQLNGQADCDIVVGGASSETGNFVDETSFISDAYSNIQDSFYYQYFSYEIGSPLQQAEYKGFVDNIIHPTGFVMFSRYHINSNLEIAPITLEDVETELSEVINVGISLDGYPPISLAATEDDEALTFTTEVVTETIVNG